jgi:hypothetical protein|nr:MAG TPA: hypothetical protein [Caudoviricetes sp.]
MNTYNGIYYEGVQFNTKEINMNFKIKVMGLNNGKPVERLVGVSGLIDEVGDKDLVNTFLQRAMNSEEDRIICKLRRGLRIIFFRQ